MKINFSVSKGSLRSADLLGIGCFEGDKPFPKVPAHKKFTGKAGETFLIMASPVKSAGVVCLIGLGKKEKFTLETVRRSAAKLLSQGKALQHKTLRLDLDSLLEKFSIDEIAGAAVEGARLSDYRFDKYKSKPNGAGAVEELELISKKEKQAKEIRKAISTAEVISAGVIFTRNLANEPPNVMTPAALAKAAQDMARKNNLKCRILYKPEISRLKMGGVLAVCQGSANLPHFVILENRVKSSSKPIVLVGKGVTFDSGGISIKPSNDMDKMKFDMCGAAAVMGAMKVIANLKLPVKVVALAPLAENMSGCNAQRPGDIIKCLNGKTVEVLNTDAEGRLILADALSFAARYKPKALIDIATLTGSCAATFADVATGLLGTDPALLHRIKAAGQKTGERCWELPLWDDYADFIKATYADVQNIGKKYAGAITATMFLKEFADHTPAWAHLDIAGTAWNENGAKPLSPIGATGVGVRLLVETVKSFIH